MSENDERTLRHQALAANIVLDSCFSTAPGAPKSQKEKKSTYLRYFP